MMALGDQDGAIEMIVSNVRKGAASFQSAGSIDNLSSRYRQMAQFVRAYGLSESILDAMAPADGAADSERLGPGLSGLAMVEA